MANSDETWKTPGGGEAFYRELFEAAADGIYVIDPSGRFVEVNAAGCALLGYERDEFLQKGVQDVVAPEEVFRAIDLAQRLQAGEGRVETWSLRRKDGSVQALALSVCALPGGGWQASARGVAPAAALESELRESEHRFQALADHSPVFIWMTDARLRVTRANRSVLTFLGLPDVQALTESGWSRVVHRADAPNLQRVSGEAVAAAQPFVVEVRFREAATGMNRWHEVRGVPRMIAGRLVGFVGTGIDIDERKKAALRDRFLLEVANAARPLTSPEDIVETAAALLGRHLDADRCAYADVEPDEDTFNVLGNYTRGLASIVGRYRMADFGAEALRRHRAGEPFVVADVEHDLAEPGERESYRRAGIGAVISVPLMKAGRFVGGMAVHQTGARTWTADDVELVRFTANLCWESIERSRVGRELEASERRLRLALTSGRLVCWEVEAATGRAVVLDNVAEVFGLPVGETFKHTTEGFAQMHPEDETRHREEFARALADGQGYVSQFRMRRRDNQGVVWVEERTLALRDAAGKTERLIGVMIDITERKRAEEEAGRLLKAVQAEHERVTEILESIGDAFYAVDAEFRFTHVNHKAEELWGRSRGELLGRHYWTEFPKAVGSESYRRHLTAMTERRPVRYETISPVLGRWIDVSIYPERGGGLSCYFRDIERRKRAEQRLRDQEQRQRFLLGLGDRLRSHTEATTVMAAAAEELGRHLRVARVGYGEIDGLESTVHVERDWTDGRVFSLAGESRPLESFGVEIIAELRAGRTLRLDDIDADPRSAPSAAGYASIGARALLIVPLIKAGHFTAILYLHEPAPRVWTEAETGLIEAVAERTWAAVETARAQQALRQAHGLLADKAAHLETLVEQRTAKLRETIDELESFSYSIAHDLRAPLRSLHGYADVLLDDHADRLDEQGRGFLQRIGRAATRMDELIRDVLDYSRLVRLDLPLEPVEVGPLLRDIAETYPPFAPDKAEVRIEGEFPRVRGNEALLTQVFANLMGNAVKFVAPGVKPRVQVRATRAGPWVRVSVQDNGIGIPSAQHERIFRMFEQLNKGFEGTGIGLAIVKKAVDRLGGQVGVQSAPASGSTFWVDLRPSD